MLLQVALISQDKLLEATLDAAAAIDGALLIEADDIGTGVFESGAVRMAEILDSLLDRPA